ncbi:MAG TPA: ankyrin repeat domain-containing protein [Candidatus Acidoferrales bacterium]
MNSMRTAVLLLLTLAASLPLYSQTPQEEEFFAAVRRGDLSAVRAALDAGMDVNAKYRYGATALFPACDRGHVEIVKLLLERGAEVNVQDTFYRATPLGWAANKGHAEIIKLLLDKGATGIDAVLMSGVSQNRPEIVRLALAKGGVSAQTLTSALGNAQRQKREEIVKLLEDAGATPPPKADFQVDAATLAGYAGTYRAENGGEFVFFMREGRFMGGPAGQNPFPMNAINKTTFRPGEIDTVSLVFNVEGDKVASVTLNQGGQQIVYKRVEEKQE